MKKTGIAAVLAATLAMAGCTTDTPPPASVPPNEPTVVRVGYIPGAHDVAQLFVADEKGYFSEQGLTIEATPFQTGISLSQALTGGSLDVGVMGAVVANFPAKGQGVVFVLNNQQVDIHQIWVAPDSGIETIEDLRGATIATTTGAAGDVILQAALDKAGLTRADLEVVNLDMPAAVNAFITDAVDAVSTWSPFDQQIEENLPGAKRLATAAELDTPISGGWVANNEFFAEHRDVVVAMTKAWQKANEDLVADPAAALAISCPRIQENMPQERCEYLYSKTEAFSNEEWATFYQDGTAVGWLSRMQTIFGQVGALEGATKQPEEYLDTTVFPEALAG